MAKFLNRFESRDELERIIREAEHQLILISPYIKLGPEIKEALSIHLNNPQLEITVVYGKNEEDKRKSISDEDYSFFKTFSNISIRYHKRLHAKMYANDLKCLTTSMNLHDYSLRENIETGILTEFKLLDIASGLLSIVAPKVFTESLDSQATNFVDYIVNKSSVEFERKAKKESSFLGFNTKYTEGEITIDKARTGFCIRTKEAIPLNPAHPYSVSAYTSWNKYGNANYEEKFCHQCGKPNKSSMTKPVCYDCYKSN